MLMDHQFIQVDMEWIKFNQQFNVYAMTQEEAFYALTPRFMERLSSANERNKYIRFCFVDDRLFLMINHRQDTFDLRLFKPLNQSFLNQIINEIEFVRDVIEDLK